MSIDAIIAIKNDGATYLLDYISPARYLNEEGIPEVIKKQTEYTMEAGESGISLKIQIFELKDKKCVCRTSYIDTLYHVAFAGNGTKEQINKISDGIRNFLTKKSHSSNPNITVQYKGFKTPVIPGYIDEDYNVLCVHDLINNAYLEYKENPQT